jgi:hypothetical protein
MADYPSVREALRRSADAEDAKVSKASVGYEHPAVKPPQHCGTCEHWQPPNSCKVVSGRIQPQDWCKRYRKA